MTPQGMGAPDPMSVHWDGLVGDGCSSRSFSGEHWAPSSPQILWVSTGQGHDLGKPCEGFPPALSSLLPAWAEEALWPLCAKFAAGQRPFPTPLETWNSLEGQKAWRDSLSPCPSTVLRDWMRTGFWHSMAQSRRVPKGLILETSSIQATAYGPGSCPREHHCQRA